MNEVELKRKSIELKRVQVACEEMELAIFEKTEEIERIKIQIEIQKKKEIELKQLLGKKD